MGTLVIPHLWKALHRGHQAVHRAAEISGEQLMVSDHTDQSLNRRTLVERPCVSVADRLEHALHAPQARRIAIAG